MILFVRLFTAYPTFRRLMTEKSWKDWGPIYNSTLPPTAAKTGGHGSEEPVEWRVSLLSSAHTMRLPIHLFPHQSQSIIPEKIYHNYSRNNLKEEWSEIHWCSEEMRGNRNGHWGKPDCLKGILMPSAKLIVILSWHKNQIRHNSIIRASSRRWMLPTSSKKNSLGKG